MACRRMSVQLLRTARIRCAPDARQIRRIELVLSSNSNQREQGIAPGICQRGTHLMRCRGVADRADRPVGGYPFPGGVCEYGSQPNEPILLTDGSGLHGRDLVFAHGLA